MEYLDLVFLHLATVVPAFFIGTYMLFAKKGDALHKLIGKIYLVLMGFTAVITLFMPATVGPKFLSHFGYIHLFSFLTLYSVPTGYISAKRGHHKNHMYSMISLYFGALVIAGGFAFMPGRLLNNWFFG